MKKTLRYIIFEFESLYPWVTGLEEFGPHQDMPIKGNGPEDKIQPFYNIKNRSTTYEQFPHTPNDYRHTDKHLRLVMVLIQP